ncbi:MAG TPA: DNA repair protein RecO [Cyclobacteriaceae bacterium]
MIAKTKGIVFRFTRFRESSIIVTILTEAFGIQSYIVNGVRSSKTTAGKMALYQPLTLLDMVVYHRDNANINRIREVKCPYPYHSVATDVRKSAIAMFVCEILNKTVREETAPGPLFDFIFNSLRVLETLEKNYENFHLLFLIKLSRHLGFGVYTAAQIGGTRPFDRETESVVESLLTASYDETIGMTVSRRREILEALVAFFGEHIESLGEIRSVQVLREVLS